MATAYHRDDLGAPTFAYGDTSGAGGFTALKAILIACLVTGYGSKPPAGWELVSEGASHLVLRNGSQSGYVCFTRQPGNAYVTVYLSETYSGVTSNVMVGGGLKTGLDANNSVPQRINITYVVWVSAACTWHLVADAKTFILNMTGYPSNAPQSGVDVTSYSPVIYVGEDSAGNFISVGGINSGTNGAPVAAFNGKGMTSLRDPGTGLLVDSGSLVVKLPGFEVSLSDTSVVPLPEITLSKAVWFGSGVFAGRLRGICLSTLLHSMWPHYIVQSLGNSAGLTTRNANTPLNLNDPHIYFPTAKHYQSVFFLTTTNPAFW